MNYRFYYISKDMAQRLFEEGLIKEDDLDKVRKAIQHMLEEN